MEQTHEKNQPLLSDIDRNKELFEYEMTEVLANLKGSFSRMTNQNMQCHITEQEFQALPAVQLPPPKDVAVTLNQVPEYKPISTYEKPECKVQGFEQHVSIVKIPEWSAPELPELKKLDAVTYQKIANIMLPDPSQVQNPHALKVKNPPVCKIDDTSVPCADPIPSFVIPVVPKATIAPVKQQTIEVASFENQPENITIKPVLHQFPEIHLSDKKPLQNYHPEKFTVKEFSAIPVPEMPVLPEITSSPEITAFSSLEVKPVGKPIVLPVKFKTVSDLSAECKMPLPVTIEKPDIPEWNLAVSVNPPPAFVIQSRPESRPEIPMPEVKAVTLDSQDILSALSADIAEWSSKKAG